MKKRILRLFCSKLPSVWALFFAILIWLLFIASLHAYYEYKISVFEAKFSLLKVGMTAREVIDILGPPQSMNRVMHFTPVEAVPEEQIVLAYHYSKRTFGHYESRGILIDAEKQQVVKISPFRPIVIVDGIWPWNLFMISFLFILLVAEIIMKMICRDKYASSS